MSALTILLQELKRNRIVNDIVRRPPFVYKSLVNDFTRVERFALDERRVFHDGRLRNILALARRLPAYSSVEGEAYGDFPILEKSRIRDCPEDFLRTVPIRSFGQTGGTSGTPLEVWRSPASVVAEQVCIDRLVARSGLSLARARIAVLRGDNVKSLEDRAPPFWIADQGGKRLVMSSNHLVSETASHYLNALKEFQPDILYVYPTTLSALLAQMKEGARLPSTLRLVLSSSEVLSDELRNELRTRFGIDSYDYYGQAERINFAYSTNSGTYFFEPAYGSTELRFSRHEEDADIYEIIGTSFWNRAQVLVRYRTGDLARLPKGIVAKQIERITLGLDPFLGIVGRDKDYLISPDGARLVGLDHIPRGVGGILQMQIVQQGPAQVYINVLPGSSYTQATEDLIIANARAKILLSMSVELRVVRELQHTAQGKTPFVLRSGQ